FRLAGYEITDDSTLVNYTCGAKNPDGSEVRDDVNEWVDANLLNDTIPVIINKQGGPACSSPIARFVRMLRPNAGEHERYYVYDPLNPVVESGPSAKLLGHEMGHYFELGHTFWGGLDSREDIEAYLKKNETEKNHASIHNLDADRLDPSWLEVYDTMPGLVSSGGPDNDIFDREGGNRCSDSQKYVFHSNFSTVVVSPDLHNAMVYGYCDEISRLTKDQVRAVRQSLFSTRSHLVRILDDFSLATHPRGNLGVNWGG
ncbi:MAG: hypothetical protein ACT4QE_21720, partial [Anaerolineales bacterium]